MHYATVCTYDIACGLMYECTPLVLISGDQSTPGIKCLWADVFLCCIWLDWL